MNAEVLLLKNMLQRNATECDSDEEYLREAENKLMRILQTSSLEGSDGEQKTYTEFIRLFLTAGEVQKHKISAYCVDFIDPGMQASGVTALREEVCFHAFLKQSELYKLYQFVKRHQDDRSFGEVVYEIMDRHGMTAPQVYKNALLRRQDFARVTDVRCKSVTRKMAWQIVIGLHCSMQEADEVLFSAGYIRRKSRLDLTMQYFIENENYDIEAIDAVLSEFGIKTFACD